MSNMGANGNDTPTEFRRNDLYEALKLSRLPDKQNSSQDGGKRFMSRTPAWRPGDELPWKRTKDDFPRGAFGGHVYAQAPLAAARAVEEDEKEAGGNGNGKLGIHVSLQSPFTGL
jgi:hypothetical protein